MSQATCIALSAVFPLLLVTMAIEHRRVIRDVRRHQRVFNWIVESGMLAALVGLVVTVVGVETDGIDHILGFTGWAAFAWSVFVLFGYLLWIVLQDREDHAAVIERERQETQRRERDEQARREREAIEAARRSRVWWRRFARRSRGRLRAQ
jgi:heme exporter protein D